MSKPGSRRAASPPVRRFRTGKRHDTRNRGDIPDWPLADRGPIEVYDEYTDQVVRLAPGQRNPVGIEGLLIDFRYISRDSETSRRSLLCWQCGRDDKRLYVRGYCPFREALRTFRVDRMRDVMAMQAGRYVVVDDVEAYFAAYAAGHAKERARLLLD